MASAPFIEFPLKSMKVDIDVKSAMAAFTLEQVFENPLTQTMKAVYVFPLGDEAAISSYEILPAIYVYYGTSGLMGACD